MKSTRFLFLIIGVIALGVCQPDCLWSQMNETTRSPIETLIKKLENDDFQIRESAERELIRVGIPAARLLAGQVIVGTPESAMRSARILQDIGARANDESEMLRLSCAMDYLANHGFPHFQNAASQIASRWKIEQAEKIREQIGECGIEFSNADFDDPFGQAGMPVVRGNIIVRGGGGQIVMIQDDPGLYAEQGFEAPGIRRTVRPDNERLHAEINEIFEADESTILQRMKQTVLESQAETVSDVPPDPFEDQIQVINGQFRPAQFFDQPTATVAGINENTVKGLELMRLLPAVPQVAFRECDIPDEVINALAKVPGLQVVSLIRCQYQPAGLLKLLESNPNIAIDATGHDAFLGVSVQADLIITEEGDGLEVCVVLTVVEESAAALAGIQPGDQIVEIDGLRVSEFSHLIVCIASHQVGDEVVLKYVSDGEERVVTVALRKRPDSR